LDGSLILPKKIISIKSSKTAIYWLVSIFIGYSKDEDEHSEERGAG
jgi:hypothetical protein